MPVLNALASLAVRDLDVAVAWYARVLGEPPHARPMPELAEWWFARGGQLQVYRGPERAGQGSVTLIVDDLAAQVEHLRACGVSLGAQSHDERVQTAMVKDPDGNSIAFAQPADPSLAP